MICCNPLKTSELWHHEIFGHEIHGFLSTFEKAMKCHFHGYFMASRSLYSIFHGSWIWKFSQVFHGIFQVFFMALRPWKCHWFNHENPVKNLWIYNELFHKIFTGFEFIVIEVLLLLPWYGMVWYGMVWYGNFIYTRYFLQVYLHSSREN